MHEMYPAAGHERGRHRHPRISKLGFWAFGKSFQQTDPICFPRTLNFLPQLPKLSEETVRRVICNAPFNNLSASPILNFYMGELPRALQDTSIRPTY